MPQWSATVMKCDYGHCGIRKIELHDGGTPLRLGRPTDSVAIVHSQGFGSPCLKHLLLTYQSDVMLQDLYVMEMIHNYNLSQGMFDTGSCIITHC